MTTAIIVKVNNVTTAEIRLQYVLDFIRTDSFLGVSVDSSSDTYGGEGSGIFM